MTADSTTAIGLYRKMLLVRHTEETIARRYSEWKMRCPTHLCTGQEAIAAGVCHALRKDDFVVSSHRAHGHYLAKGGNLNAMIAEIYGKATGCSKGRGGSMHLIDTDVGFMGSTAIVGGTIPIGVGLGLSIKLRRTGQISCVFFGDAAVEEGVFYESVNFAVVKKLPILFICENNLYSVYSPLKVRQPEGRKIYKMVEALGVQCGHGDGNNAIEVHEKVLSVTDSVRNDSGPFFLEFSTYRWREHCGPNFDNDIGYRSEEEFLSWEKRDPLRLMKAKIIDECWMSKQELDDIPKEVQNKVEAAFDFAEASPFPSMENLTSGDCSQ